MTLRDQALKEAHRLVDSALATVASAIEREMLRRQAEPEIWYRFHSIMAQRLPRWRLLARAHHIRMSRRYDAMRISRLSEICTAMEGSRDHAAV